MYLTVFYKDFTICIFTKSTQRHSCLFKGGGALSYIFIRDFIICILSQTTIFVLCAPFKSLIILERDRNHLAIQCSPWLLVLLNPNLSNLGGYKQFVLVGHPKQTFSSINLFPLIEELAMESLRKCAPFPNRENPDLFSIILQN